MKRTRSPIAFLTALLAALMCICCLSVTAFASGNEEGLSASVLDALGDKTYACGDNTLRTGEVDGIPALVFHLRGNDETLPMTFYAIKETKTGFRLIGEPMCPAEESVLTLTVQDGIVTSIRVAGFPDNEHVTYSALNGTYTPAKKPAKTTGVTVSNAADSITVTWDKMAGATGYKVYRSKDGGSFVSIATVTSPKYQDKTAKSGAAYRYKIKAVAADLVGAESDIVSITRLEKPVISSVASSASGVTVKWDKVAGATAYKIYRRVGTGEWKLYKNIDSGSTVSYTNTAVTSGSKYGYKVVAVAGSSKSVDSAIKSTYCVAKPVISAVTNGTGSITVKWDKIAGATGYKVYRKVGTGEWKLRKTITDGATVSYADSGVTNGSKYSYKVVAIKTVGSTDYKSVESAVKSSYRLERPTIASAANSAAGKIKVTWDKNTKATGYQVKYVKDGVTKTVKVTSNATLTKTISSLTKGSYSVSVRSYKTVGESTSYSAYSAAKTVKVS